MTQVLVDKNERQEEIAGKVGAHGGILVWKMSYDYEHRLPLPAIGDASDNYAQFGEATDIALVTPKQGEQGVDGYVSTECKNSALHAFDSKKPIERDFHTPFDGKLLFNAPRKAGYEFH